MKRPTIPPLPQSGIGLRKQTLVRKKKPIVCGELGVKIHQVINIEQVYQMARAFCSQDEMAAILGVRRDHFAEAVQSNYKLAHALELGYGETRQSLRKVQLEMALSGNPALLIWLGKQYLGQRDKHETETTTTVNILVQNAMQELNAIPKERLLEARAALRGNAIDAQSETIEAVSEAEQSNDE